MKRPCFSLVFLTVLTFTLVFPCGSIGAKKRPSTKLVLESIKKAEEDLTIAEDKYGGEHMEVAEAIDRLADLRHQQGQWSEALTLYRRSLPIKENHLGKNRPDVAVTLARMAKCLNEMGKSEEAAELTERAMAIRSNVEANINTLGRPDKLPRIIRKISPIYPSAAKRRNIQGSVTVRFIVSREGRVFFPSVLKSDPPGVFDNSAVEA